MGVVFDSTAGAPLAGATVFLSGTTFEAGTDSTGFFRMDSVPDGEQTVGLIHPRLDSLGLSVTRPVSLRRGRASNVHLAIPAAAAPPAALCGGPAPAGTGLLVGTVSDERSGTTLPGAEVALSWTDAGSGEARRLSRVTGAAGRFVLCGAPLEVPLSVRALLLGRTGAPRELRLGSVDPVEVDLALRLGTRPVPVPGRRTIAGPGAAALLRGRVTDAAGSPAAGAMVRLEGTDLREVSGADGRFLMTGIAADAYVIAAEDGSGGAVRLAVEVRVGENRVELRLASPGSR